MRSTKWGDQFKKKQTAILPLPRRAPKYPPDALDAADGWPRIVGVRYMEPNPAAPDDRSKDIERISWAAINRQDSASAALLALETALQIGRWAREEEGAALAAAGVQLQQSAARIAALEAELAGQRTEDRSE